METLGRGDGPGWTAMRAGVAAAEAMTLWCGASVAAREDEVVRLPVPASHRQLYYYIFENSSWGNPDLHYIFVN